MAIILQDTHQCKGLCVPPSSIVVLIAIVPCRAIGIEAGCCSACAIGFTERSRSACAALSCHVAPSGLLTRLVVGNRSHLAANVMVVAAWGGGVTQPRR